MMGYSDLSQTTKGIHLRLKSRAFVIEEPTSGVRVAIVVADLGMVFNSIKKDILRKLQMEFPNMYTDSNLLLSATHTHSGPGGFSDNDLFNVTAPYDRQNFDIISEEFFSLSDKHI